MVLIVKEKRFGFLPLTLSPKKSHQRRSIEPLVEFSLETIGTAIDKERSKRPGRILPLQLL